MEQLTLDFERWLPAVEWEDLYEVSSRGGVRSLDRLTSAGRIVRGMTLRPSPTPDGYLHVSLCRAGRRSDTYVHRMVLAAFVGPQPPGHQCRHLDSNPGNNRLQNLQWATQAVNETDKVARGTLARGARHGNARLTADQVRAMRRLHGAGMYMKDIGRQFGVGRSTVSLILSGHRWQHVK